MRCAPWRSDGLTVLQGAGKDALFDAERVGADDNPDYRCSPLAAAAFHRSSAGLTTAWPGTALFDNNATIASAIPDRLHHHCEIIIVEGQSYRMQNTAKSVGNDKPAISPASTSLPHFKCRIWVESPERPC